MKMIGGFILLMAVALLLRSTALSALSGRGIVIDVLVFVTVVWSLRHGESAGTTFGFLIGLAADLDAAHWVGRHALVLSALGYVVGRLSHTLVRDSFRTQVVLLAVTAIVHQAWTTAFEIRWPAGWLYLLQRAGLAALATAPIGAAILWFIGRIGGHGVFSNASHESGQTG